MSSRIVVNRLSRELEIHLSHMCAPAGPCAPHAYLRVLSWGRVARQERRSSDVNKEDAALYVVVVASALAMFLALVMDWR